EVVGQRALGQRVVDTEGDKGATLLEGELDLTADLGRGVGVGGEHEHGRARPQEAVHDGSAPVRPGHDVSRRDPAADALALERVTDGIGDGLVVRGMADKDVAVHGSSDGSLPSWVLW